MVVCQCCPFMAHSILGVTTDPINPSICPYGTCYQRITIFFLPIADDLDFEDLCDVRKRNNAIVLHSPPHHENKWWPPSLYWVVNKKLFLYIFHCYLPLWSLHHSFSLCQVTWQMHLVWQVQCCTEGCFSLHVWFSTFSLVQGKAIFGNDNEK